VISIKNVTVPLLQQLVHCELGFTIVSCDEWHSKFCNLLQMAGHFESDIPTVSYDK
jgi:hypothetical protein